MNKIYTILIALILAITVLPATIADYYQPPVASVGTYTAVVGGINAGSGVDDDEYISAALPIGFTFNYCGTDYTTFKMCSNGYVGLGENQTAPFYLNDLASTTINPIITPIWDDLKCPIGSMVYLVTGDAPSRVLTVQYTNVRWAYSGTAGQNFQVQLYETTNQVKLVYGTLLSASIASASIGMNFGAGGYGNFYSITPTAIGAMSYSMSVSNNVIGNTQRVFITSGTTYTFTPVQTGIVPAPAFAVSPLNGATGVWANSTLNWLSGGGFPTDYDLYFGTSPFPDYIGNLTTTTYNPGILAYGTTYYWQVMPENSHGFADNCPVWSFTTQVPVTSYPFTEGFENATWYGNPAAPLNWSQINVSGAKTWLRYTQLNHTGSGCARVTWDAGGGSSLLITPPLNLGTNNYVLKFWLKGLAQTPGTDLKVQIGSSCVSAGNFTTDLAYYVGGTNMPAVWTLQTIDLSAYEGLKFIAFRDFDPIPGGTSVWLDDISIELIPPQAPNPVTLVAPAAGATGVSNLPTLSWTPSGTGSTATDFQVYCDTNPSPTTQVGDPAASPFTLTTPLNYSTTYYWKVVAHNADGLSTGNVTQSFTTMALPTPVVTMTLDAGLPKLSWNPVTGANSYYIYREFTPYAPFSIDSRIAQVNGSTTIYPVTGVDDMIFYKVKASTDQMP